MPNNAEAQTAVEPKQGRQQTTNSRKHRKTNSSLNTETARLWLGPLCRITAMHTNAHVIVATYNEVTLIKSGTPTPYKPLVMSGGVQPPARGGGGGGGLDIFGYHIAQKKMQKKFPTSGGGGRQR